MNHLRKFYLFARLDLTELNQSATMSQSAGFLNSMSYAMKGIWHGHMILLSVTFDMQYVFYQDLSLFMNICKIVNHVHSSYIIIGSLPLLLWRTEHFSSFHKYLIGTLNIVSYFFIVNNMNPKHT